MFLLLTAVTFSLFGFIIGIWADGFEKLQLVPLLIVTPLTFLGGSFYSIDMLPPFWQKVTLFNPVVYLISGFRWSFYGHRGRERRRQPGHDRDIHGSRFGDRGLDLQDGLSAQDLDAGRDTERHTRCSRPSPASPRLKLPQAIGASSPSARSSHTVRCWLAAVRADQSRPGAG